MWDWPFLLYVGTVLLKRTEAAFWRTTPRKLNVLIETHLELNKSSNDDEAIPKNGTFIDQIF